MFTAQGALRIPFDPVTVSYVMALRGVRGRLPKEAFTYAEICCGKAERLILLAACNPEGTFFGFDPSLEALNVAAEIAERYGVKNVTFSQASAETLKEASDNKIIAAKAFDYLVYNEIDNPVHENLAAVLAVAKALLRDNGAFVYRYRTYEAQAEDALFHSVTRHLLAEQPEKGEEVAKEIRALAQIYFSARPQEAFDFDKAIEEQRGAAWLREKCSQESRPSKVLNVAQVFAGKDFTFLGSAKIANNYLELSTPEPAHAYLTARRQHPLYEALKDLAMNNSERVDVWGREPLTRSENLVTLFGGFTYGTTEIPERISRTVIFQSRSISFVGPIYDSILSLATVIPVTMGDLVHHESLKGVDSVSILNTVHMLVACGVLQPMRASFEGGIEGMENPKLIGGYNRSARDATLEFTDYAFASTVVGRPVILSAMNALVMQMLDRGGFDSVAALLSSEMMRLADHHYLRPLDLKNPEKAMAESLRQIENALNQSLVRWFSLGLIDSAAA